MTNKLWYDISNLLFFLQYRPVYLGPQNEGYEDPSEHERRPRCQQRPPAPHGDQLGDVDVVDAALDAGPKTKEESRTNIPRIAKFKISS